MKTRLTMLVAFCAFAASYRVSDGPTVIEREESDTSQTTLFDEVEAFAMGSHAGDDIRA